MALSKLLQCAPPFYISCNNILCNNLQRGLFLSFCQLNHVSSSLFSSTKINCTLLHSVAVVYDRKHWISSQPDIEASQCTSVTVEVKGTAGWRKINFRMSSILRLLLLSTFLVSCLSAPKFHLVETVDEGGKRGEDEVGSSQEGEGEEERVDKVGGNQENEDFDWDCTCSKGENMIFTKTCHQILIYFTNLLLLDVLILCVISSQQQCFFFR